MRFQSPLSNLSDVLSQVKDAAKHYQETLTRNEAATRAALIDPVLRALGWDTANTNMVEVEKTLGQVKADYALFDYNKEPKVVVEAKSLGTNLNQPNLIMSLVSYAFQGRLNEVFLTDGIVWSHFDTFQPRNVSPAKTINIETDDPVACAAYLVQHLDAAQFWPEGETIDILAQKINELENTIATLQKDVASLRATCPVNPAGDGQIPTSRPSQIPPGMVFVDLHTITDATGKGVASLRLPDGTVLNTKSWTAVLRACFGTMNSRNSQWSLDKWSRPRQGRVASDHPTLEAQYGTTSI